MQSSSSQQARRPNTKHMVVLRIGEIKISSGGGNLWLCTAVLGGDHFTPNMEAADNVLTSPTVVTCPTVLTVVTNNVFTSPTVVTGLLSAAIYCPPMSTPKLSSSYYLIFTIYNFEFPIHNLSLSTIHNSELTVSSPPPKKTLPLPKV